MPAKRAASTSLAVETESPIQHTSYNFEFQLQYYTETEGEDGEHVRRKGDLVSSMVTVVAPSSMPQSELISKAIAKKQSQHTQFVDVKFIGCSVIEHTDVFVF